MPELPEVETVRISLAEKLVGQTIRRVQTFRANLRYDFPAQFAERLAGRRIVAVQRWSKYLLLGLDNGLYWLIHLGMSGQCRLVRTEDHAQKHDHLEVDFDDNLRLHYRDPRRFGFMDLLDNPERYPAFARLGREAICTVGTYPKAAQLGTVDAAYLQQALTAKRSSIKQVLFDQKVIAGLGNIYINEVLWMVGIHPQSVSSAVPRQLCPALAEAIAEVMTKALQAGGSSLKDFTDTDGSLGYFQHAWQAYGNENKPCTKVSCTGTIQRATHHGRSSFFCNKHQIHLDTSIYLMPLR